MGPVVGGDVAYAGGVGGDVAYAGDSSGDVAVIVDENTPTWPNWAFTRGAAAMAVWWDGDGGLERNDGTMFGNHPLPNIAIINNQCLIYYLTY